MSFMVKKTVVMSSIVVATLAMLAAIVVSIVLVVKMMTPAIYPGKVIEGQWVVWDCYGSNLCLVHGDNVILPLRGDFEKCTVVEVQIDGDTLVVLLECDSGPKWYIVDKTTAEIIDQYYPQDIPK